MSGPIPRCPSKGPCWSRSSRMLDLLPYFNEDAPSRTYGDGNTAMAQGKAAMYLQGPWVLVEIEKAGTDVQTCALPISVTDDPADRRIRVNIDLSLWIPEQANEQDGARELLQHLMIPDIQFPYNELALAFSTTDDAPEVSDPRISEMQPYYDEGKFYRQGEVLYGRFAVHPDHHPVRQLHPIDRARGPPRATPRPDRLRLRPTRLPRLNCPSTVELEDTVCQRRHPSIRVPGPPGNSTIPVPPLPPP